MPSILRWLQAMFSRPLESWNPNAPNTQTTTRTGHDTMNNSQAVTKLAKTAAQRQAAMLAVMGIKPMTECEAARECVTQCGGDFEAYRKRSGELKSAGLVYVVQTRRCADSGRNAEELAVR